MRSHFNRIINNKLSLLMFTIIILIPLFDLFQLIKSSNLFNIIYHPAFASFLSGAARGHAAQILLLWFLPLYFLLFVADDPIQDYKTGYRYILISKLGKKKYCLEKLMSSFIFSFSAMSISLLINFEIAYTVFYGGTYNNDLSKINLSNNMLFNISIDHPYIAYLCFALICCTMAGCAGLLGASLSLFFLDREYVYPATFFIWFLMVLKQHSLMYLFQPFAEYGFDILIPIFILAILVFSIIPALVFIYEVKVDEN
ncbi:DUF2705 family protein [Terrilactibacillus laevilacticus]|uniref:DUF2705 family protein n=1 Tax=Terrilactibacillus laevilacticus TaxID=1380157 RepID=UPI001146BBC2|nr:DUF2705 family protein [Terrilactibacillus laevilacticus]